MKDLTKEQARDIYNKALRDKINKNIDILNRNGLFEAITETSNNLNLNLSANLNDALFSGLKTIDIIEALKKLGYKVDIKENTITIEWK